MTYNAAYQKRWTYDRHRGIDRSLVPASAVREHLAHLHRSGLSLRAIGDTANVSPTVISRVLNGKTGDLQRPVAARLLAVTARDVYERPNAAGFVPKVGAVRRIRALYAIGWTGDQVNQTAARSARFAQNLLNQPGDWITLDAWRAVARAYDQLWDKPGPSTVNCRRAKTAGWAPPMAYDDETIDDPTATPFVDEPTDITRSGTGRVNVDSLTDCAHEWGLTMQQAADRLSVRRGSIDYALRRLDDTDLAEQLRAAFERNAVAQGHDQPTRDGLGLRRTA